MDLNYKNIVQELLHLIPQLKPLYDKELEELWQEEGELPPHIAFGDILCPLLIELLSKEMTLENEKLQNEIFQYLENMALSNEVEVQEVVCVTVMARLGDETWVLKKALKYMGKETKQLSREIEAFWGREGNLKIL